MYAQEYEERQKYEEEYEEKPLKQFSRFRASLYGGWDYRIAKMSDQLTADEKEHYKKMKSGFHYDARFDYFFNRFMGTGLKFDQQIYGASSPGYLTETGATGNVKDNITISYIGPDFCFRLMNRKRTKSFFINFGFGYLIYKERMSLLSESTTITSGTLGSSMNIGYEIGLSKNMALGIQLSTMSGILSSLSTENGKVKLEDEKDNLSNIGLSIGLSFNK
jgi:hypothetical protein